MRIDITEQKEPCFAMIVGHCKLLTQTKCTGCKFYKPRRAADWVRIERGNRVYIMPPEEFFKED